MLVWFSSTIVSAVNAVPLVSSRLQLYTLEVPAPSTLPCVLKLFELLKAGVDCCC